MFQYLYIYSNNSEIFKIYLLKSKKKNKGNLTLVKIKDF